MKNTMLKGMIDVSLNTIKRQWEIAGVPWGYEIKDELNVTEIWISPRNLGKILILKRECDDDDLRWTQVAMDVMAFGLDAIYKATVILHREKSFDDNNYVDTVQYPLSYNDCKK